MKIYLSINGIIDTKNFVKGEYGTIKRIYSSGLTCDRIMPPGVKEAIEKFLKGCPRRALEKEDPALVPLVDTINKGVCSGYVINDEF